MDDTGWGLLYKRKIKKEKRITNEKRIKKREKRLEGLV
jgi:hypothetical protein